VSAASNAVNSDPPPPERGPIELSGLVPAAAPGVVVEVVGAVVFSVSTARSVRQRLSGTVTGGWLESCSALIDIVCSRLVAEFLLTDGWNFGRSIRTFRASSARLAQKLLYLSSKPRAPKNRRQ
jgi:hypothetical protein